MTTTVKVPTVKPAAAECSTAVVHAESVRKAREALPSEEAIHRLADFFKILGDPTRIRILEALVISELCVCDIASLLRVGRSAVSHQLATLRQANLVAYRRAGKTVYYRLSDDHVKLIIDLGFEHTAE